MALVTERHADIRGDWLTFDITYDDTTLRIEEIVMTANPPAGFRVWAELRRGGNPNPWRSGSWITPTVDSESRPFGGGFNTLDDIQGHAFGWEPI